MSAEWDVPTDHVMVANQAPVLHPSQQQVLLELLHTLGIDLVLQEEDLCVSIERSVSDLQAGGG